MILGTWLVENHALTIGHPPVRSIIKIDDLWPVATLFDPCDLRESALGSASVPVAETSKALWGEIGFQPAGPVGEGHGCDNGTNIEFCQDAADLRADRVERNETRFRHIFGGSAKR